MIKWLQIHIDSSQQDTELLESLLILAGAVSVTFEDAANQPLLEPAVGTTPLWDHVRVTGLFENTVDPDAIVNFLLQQKQLAQPLSFTLEPLADQDWERRCLENFKPLHFGKRLWICPSWDKIHDEDAVCVILDPGLAFGTGTHPTTALCLEWLDTHPPLSQRMIDFGCGSGILALAALKLGAQHVWAVDHDPQALEATRNNGQNNHFDDSKLTVCSPEQLPQQQVDIIIANILAKPLQELMPLFTKLIKPGGYIVLSGILEEQIQEVTNTYQATFQFTTSTLREGWGCLVGTSHVNAT